MKEKSNFKQDELKQQKDDSSSQKIKKEKLNVYKMTAVGFFEHLSGFVLMIFVVIVLGILLFIALLILGLLKGYSIRWGNIGLPDSNLLCNWIWIFLGVTIPGVIQGVSFSPRKLNDEGHKDNPVKFGLIPSLLCCIIFPSLFAFFCLTIYDKSLSFLFEFHNFFEIIGLIFFGLVIGSVIWWRIINEKLNIRASRSWLEFENFKQNL